MNRKLLFQLILLIFVIPNSWGQDTSVDLRPFRELNQIYQRWWQITSVPEMAHMMRYPPFTYWSHDPSSEAVDISELVDSTQQSGSVHHSSSVVTEEPSSKCSADLAYILTNLTSKWALQMIDSYGKLQSGIIRGSVKWPGNFKECLSVYAPVDPVDKEYGGFHGKYCTASWELKGSTNLSAIPPINTGICIPDTCDGEVIKNTIQNIGHILSHLPVLKKLAPYISLKSVACKSDPKSPDGAVIGFTFVICVFILFVLVGSTLTVLAMFTNIWKNRSLPHLILVGPDQTLVKYETNLEANKDKAAKNEKAAMAAEHHTSLEPNGVVVNEEVVLCDAETKSDDAISVIESIFLCFCAITNGTKIFNTDTASGQLLSIHGIRFLSLTWVIMGHTYISAAPIIDNTLDTIQAIDNLPFQMVMQAPFSVDSFFLLSGFLVTYLFLKEADKRRGKINWLYFYFHRFWRLTPVYMMVVGFYMLLFKYFGSGPFWDENFGDSDRHTWWWYLLYINNFIPIKQMCVGWSWYLANDMQFYVISPLFLYPLWRWPKIGISVILSLLCVSWIVTAVLSYQNDLIPMFVGIAKVANVTDYQNKMWFSFDMIYDKPYCRIGPYLIGALLGYSLFKVGNRRQFLTWYHQLIGWTLATFCSTSVVFGLYHVDADLTLSMFYNALCRSSFAVGLAWLIFVCETGHGGFLHTLLSFKFWIPLSRLTYSAYLVHLMFIHGYYQGYQTSFYFTQTIIVANFLGLLTIAYFLAFVTSVVFEAPMLNLEKLLLKRNRSS